MDVLIVIGDQDTYHENDAEVDSTPIWLSDILCDEGIVAQFVIHARRAEILAEFGRDDVIRAMRRHEIGLHGRDVHPVLPELVEGLDWQAGLDAMRAAEGAELDAARPRLRRHPNVFEPASPPGSAAGVRPGPRAGHSVYVRLPRRPAGVLRELVRAAP